MHRINRPHSPDRSSSNSTTTNRSGMSGIFHSLKKAVGKGEARPDVEFLEAKARFEQYEQTLIKLKGNINNYLSHATAVLVCSTQISQDFTTLLDDPAAAASGAPVSHQYTATLDSSRQEHSSVAGEHVPRLTSALQTKVVAQLDQELLRVAELSRRIARRMELFSELGYYQKKVSELREDRDKRAGKGKTESASDMDKFDRNVKKLEEVRSAYDDTHTTLMAALQQLWEERIRNIGPLLIDFVKQERAYSAAYSQALSNIKM